MARNYKNEDGLNKTTEFGVTADSKLLFEHKFAWKPSEFIMLSLVAAAGAFIAIMVQPQMLGFAFLGATLYLGSVNATKKKKSLMQLFETTDGLKLYHNGRLIESSNNDKFTLADVTEVSVVQSNPQPKLILRSNAEVDGEISYIKVPLRLVRAPEFQKFINEGKANGTLKVSKQVLDEMSKWAK